MSQPEPSVVVPEIGGGGESVSGEAPLTPRSRASFKDLRRLNSMSSPKAVAVAVAPAPAASVTVAIATETEKPTVAIMEPTLAAAAVETKVIELVPTKNIAASEEASPIVYAKLAEVKRTENGMFSICASIM